MFAVWKSIEIAVIVLSIPIKGILIVFMALAELCDMAHHYAMVRAIEAKGTSLGHS